MSSVKVYWSDEVALSPITQAVKYPPTGKAMSVMRLPDPKLFPDAPIKRCPAFISYFRDAVVYRCPIDVEIWRNGEGYTWHTSLTTQTDIDELLQTRDASGILSMSDYVYFWCGEPMRIEQLHPSFIDNEFTKNCEVIPGTFDVDKWFRPLQPAFRLREGVDHVRINRGDPMYVIRFLTDKKVELFQFSTSPRIQQLAESIARANKSVGTFYTSLRNYYDAFAMRGYAAQLGREIKNNVIPDGDSNERP